MKENKNRYEERDGYIVGYTNRYNNEFYFDKDDFELLSKYYWRLDSAKNALTSIDGKNITMHKLLMGDGVYIHKNSNNSDNRKENIVNARSYHNNGKVTMNGYVAIYNPEHHRAFGNGCVYEHILVAEKMLGRLLKDEECVHHIDRNRKNNNSNNLMVFDNGRNHIAYHCGAPVIKLYDGTYTVSEEYIKKLNPNDFRMDLCPVCNKNYKYKTAKLCLTCSNIASRKVERPSKEELEKLIFEKPFTVLGEQFGVSDNAVRKWCRTYGLPSRASEINDIKKQRSIYQS